MKTHRRTRDILLLGLAPALFVITVLEHVVVPTWGGRDGNVVDARLLCLHDPARFDPSEQGTKTPGCVLSLLFSKS